MISPCRTGTNTSVRASAGTRMDHQKNLLARKGLGKSATCSIFILRKKKTFRSLGAQQEHNIMTSKRARTKWVRVGRGVLKENLQYFSLYVGCLAHLLKLNLHLILLQVEPP